MNTKLDALEVAAATVLHAAEHMAEETRVELESATELLTEAKTAGDSVGISVAQSRCELLHHRWMVLLDAMEEAQRRVGRIREARKGIE